MINNNMVVSMNYTLKDDAGNVLDTSSGKPMEYLHGHSNIIPGLEKALNGLTVGDKKEVKVASEEGYGTYDPQLRFAVDLEQFGGQTPQPGMMIQLASPGGETIMARIISVENQQVNLDANHPLAGKDLFFDVEITEIRNASQEEMAHGHPHGPNGHHH